MAYQQHWNPFDKKTYFAILYSAASRLPFGAPATKSYMLHRIPFHVSVKVRGSRVQQAL